MVDSFESHTESLNSPPSEVISVTPNDTADLPYFSRALNVSTTGEIRVTTLQGTTAVIYVVAGIVFPIRVRRIWANGTTATGIVVML